MGLKGKSSCFYPSCVLFVLGTRPSLVGSYKMQVSHEEYIWNQVLSFRTTLSSTLHLKVLSVNANYSTVICSVHSAQERLRYLPCSSACKKMEEGNLERKLNFLCQSFYTGAFPEFKTMRQQLKIWMTRTADMQYWIACQKERPVCIHDCM